MDIKEFIEKFVEIFDETDADTISPETKFRELEEWSSLSLLGLIAMVDEEFNFELTTKDLQSVNTISELFELISAH